MSFYLFVYFFFYDSPFDMPVKAKVVSLCLCDGNYQTSLEHNGQICCFPWLAFVHRFDCIFYCQTKDPDPPL